jgi:serine/threonine-protein kinase HipA
MNGRARHPTSLAVHLHDRRIGVLNRLAADRHLFAFDEAYVEDADRPTLSLSFKSASGGLVTDIRPAHMRLPPFFSNLLPEGALRDYLAAKAGVMPGREFVLLSMLGSDLPGALTVEPVDGAGVPATVPGEGGPSREAQPRLLKFSLAGVQLKFSALADGTGHLTVPADGIGGSWIVKLPSVRFPAIAGNEYAMMELARGVGIDVPEVRLVAVADIAGLPDDTERVEGQALAVRRFDRAADGGRIHMEDFAQVFGIHPDGKYEGRSYANIAAVLSAETGNAGVREYMRRLVFTVVTGNGDMHLKNWSLLYPDTRTPVLSPAYDLVATTPYIPNDELALTFGGRRGLDGIGRDQVRRFAERAKLAVSPLWEIVEETSTRIVEAWRGHASKDLLPSEVREAIDRQIRRAA